MAVSRETLRLLRELRAAVGGEADDATRALTAAWVRAWARLAPRWRVAARDVTDLAAELQHWPYAWELARIEALRHAIDTTSAELDKLSRRSDTTVAKAAGVAVVATVAADPLILASQLPVTVRAAARIAFAAAVAPDALDFITARAAQQITAATQPLSAEATKALQRRLIQGVQYGLNPREAARRMAADAEGSFNGGLGRALVLARTEILDAHRAAARASHMANRDVVAGWRWLATLDRRTCVSCVAKNGETFGVDEFGPQDHQQGRCARVPSLRSWRDMGIGLDEPADVFPDARAWFDNLPEVDQVAMMGATRLDLLRSGRTTWDDLSARRETPGWRVSYVPTSLKDLQRDARVAA